MESAGTECWIGVDAFEITEGILIAAVRKGKFTGQKDALLIVAACQHRLIEHLASIEVSLIVNGALDLRDRLIAHRFLIACCRGAEGAPSNHPARAGTDPNARKLPKIA